MRLLVWNPHRIVVIIINNYFRKIAFRGYAHYCRSDKNSGWTLTDESFNSLKFVLFGQQKVVEVIMRGE